MNPKEYLKGKEIYYCEDCGVKAGKGQERCENCRHNRFYICYLQDDVFTALEINSRDK